MLFDLSRFECTFAVCGTCIFILLPNMIAPLAQTFSALLRDFRVRQRNGTPLHMLVVLHKNPSRVWQAHAVLIITLFGGLGAMVLPEPWRKKRFVRTGEMIYVPVAHLAADFLGEESANLEKQAGFFHAPLCEIHRHHFNLLRFLSNA